MSPEQCYGEKEELVRPCAKLGEEERMLYKGSVACAACMAQLEKRSEEDPLTNLPNERAARKRFEELRRSGKPFGVIFMDLVNFKQVNETRSHRFGDNMLRVVAENIDARPRRREEDEDRLAIRKGGDEFIALVALDHRSDETLSEDIRLETVAPLYGRVPASGW